VAVALLCVYTSVSVNPCNMSVILQFVAVGLPNKLAYNICISVIPSYVSVSLGCVSPG
jgi:hypothetical protein